MDENQRFAVEVYEKKTGRRFDPDEDTVEIPVDALVFTEYQSVWPTLEEYEAERCCYDSDSNKELVFLVTVLLLEPHIPPIYVDVLPEGVALVDGAHRVSAALIAGQSTVHAQLNTINQTHSRR